MLSTLYDSWGYDTSEQFVPLAIQCGTTYDGEKKKDITYTEQESFFSEEGVKDAELLVPMCNSVNETNVELIEDDSVINNRTTQN